MITFEQLKEADPSFRISFSQKDMNSVKTLCNLDHLQDRGVVFIKNKKYYQHLLNLFKDGIPAKIGVVFQESYLNEINIQKDLQVAGHILFLAAVQSVDLAMSRFSKLFYDAFSLESDDLTDSRKTGSAQIDPTSKIADNVFLGKGVKIAANAVIHSGCAILSHSSIGENSVLYPNVVLYRNVTLGKNCRIHANTTIGSDGYGYNYDAGEHVKLWHFGGVTIGDDVEIGSGTSIDQGTFSPTLIGPGSKIDNQVHLAHNCKIGKGVLITGQAGFGGSVTLGDYVAMGGCAQFAPGVHVGAHAQIGGMAGVTGDVPAKAVYGGHPARPLNDWLRGVAAIRKISVKDKSSRRVPETV